MKRKPSPAITIAGISLFFSLAGTGIAAQHYLITSLSQIKPNVRHELRGARGPIGPSGPRGTSAATTTGSTSHPGPGVTLAANSSGTAVASCPSGEKLVAGGFITDYAYQTAPGVYPYEMATNASGEWTVSATNTTGQQVVLQAVALCQ